MAPKSLSPQLPELNPSCIRDDSVFGTRRQRFYPFGGRPTRVAVDLEERFLMVALSAERCVKAGGDRHIARISEYVKEPLTNLRIKWGRVRVVCPDHAGPVPERNVFSVRAGVEFSHRLPASADARGNLIRPRYHSRA